jgi:hypothetical protein
VRPREGYNVVLDGTGDSGPGKFLGKIQSVHDAGYKTNVLMVDAPTNQAIDRMVTRGDQGEALRARPGDVPSPSRLHRPDAGVVAKPARVPLPGVPNDVAAARPGRFRRRRERQIHNPQEWQSMVGKPAELGGPGLIHSPGHPLHGAPVRVHNVAEGMATVSHPQSPMTQFGFPAARVQMGSA